MSKFHGAGVDRRDFMRMMAGTAAAAGMSLPLASCGGSSTDKKVIVLGLDGLDPKILGALMEMGRLPNFKKLADMGSLQPLGTTMPALSPVAWSSFITGLTPGGHGIADFIARDPATYTPVFAIYKNTDPDLTISVGDIHLPIKGGGPQNLRQGKPFWAYLTERDIPAWISKIPTNFPVEETATKAIAGMGTPDLVDSYGVFSYYTSDPFEDFPNLEGGEVLYVDVNSNVVRSNLLGPVNSLRTAKDTGADPYANTSKIPFTVYLDAKADGARLDIQGQSILLKRGEYSPWVTVTFDLLPVIGSVQGIARFLLKGVAPHFQLYVTPINIDPRAQAAPVTYPVEFGAEIARDIGAFWTKGLPADMKALDHGVINDEEYVGQAELILKERMALFDHQWSRFESGLFYFYVSSTDQDAHMLWRNMDPTHPRHAESDLRFAGWIPHLYEEMDKLVAKVLPAVDDKTLVMVCSDHGFAQFARQFHLNTWLRDNGYLVLKDKCREEGGDLHLRHRLEPDRRLRHRFQRPLHESQGPRARRHRPPRKGRRDQRPPHPRARGRDRPRDRSTPHRQGLPPRGHVHGSVDADDARAAGRLYPRLPQRLGVGARIHRQADHRPQPMGVVRRPLHGPRPGPRHPAVVEKGRQGQRQHPRPAGLDPRLLRGREALPNGRQLDLPRRMTAR